MKSADNDESNELDVKSATNEFVKVEQSNGEHDQKKRRDRSVDRSLKVIFHLNAKCFFHDWFRDWNMIYVQVLGLEMTASCEGGQKCSRPVSPILNSSPKFHRVSFDEKHKKIEINEIQFHHELKSTTNFHFFVWI